ncbi:hypothetical protein HDU86_005490 [Geranomyces michiganensis]|nr:hypothetical protein HDU86_005490 [Geranomyces michiganensis]
MPGVYSSTSDLTLDAIGVGDDVAAGAAAGSDDGGKIAAPPTHAAANRVWCLVEVDKAKNTKRSESLVDGLKTAFKRSDFRFGSLMKFGNAGKIGILDPV